MVSVTALLMLAGPTSRVLSHTDSRLILPLMLGLFCLCTWMFPAEYAYHVFTDHLDHIIFMQI